MDKKLLKELAYKLKMLYAGNCGALDGLELDRQEDDELIERSSIIEHIKEDSKLIQEAQEILSKLQSTQPEISAEKERELTKQQVYEIANIAWKGAANAFRMYPENKHTFVEYWDAAENQFEKYFDSTENKNEMLNSLSELIRILNRFNNNYPLALQPFEIKSLTDAMQVLKNNNDIDLNEIPKPSTPADNNLKEQAIEQSTEILIKKAIDFALYSKVVDEMKGYYGSVDRVNKIYNLFIQSKTTIS